MSTGALINIGIGKDTRVIMISRMYNLNYLMEKLEVGTSVTITTMECCDCIEDINELLGIKEEEEV